MHPHTHQPIFVHCTLAILLLLALMTGCSPTAGPSATPTVTSSTGTVIEKNGTYTSPEDVAAYLHAYGTLPSNYITKAEAVKLGWKSTEGNLAEVAPGKSIGGESFQNKEGLLPAKEGRVYSMCDVNYTSGYRGAERLVYSNDGLVYYTADHFKSFTQK